MVLPGHARVVRICMVKGTGLQGLTVRVRCCGFFGLKADIKSSNHVNRFTVVTTARKTLHPKCPQSCPDAATLMTRAQILNGLSLISEIREIPKRDRLRVLRQV